MRKWLVLVISTVLLFPFPVQAQGTVKMDTLKVLLWSEYDQPSMLVIQDFTLTEDSQIPATMDIRIPKEANITAVAYLSGGEYLLGNYQPQDEEDANWQRIQLFVTERTTYRVEYYQPLLRDGDKRSFTYQWTGDFSVNELDIELQVPDDSRGIITDPVIPLMQNQPFLSGGARSSGLGQGESYVLQLEYSRSSDVVAATPPSSQVEPIVPVDENTDGRSTLDNLPLLLGGFGIALILAALYFFFRGQSSQTRKIRARRRSSSPQDPAVASYCSECGTRAQESDRFCRVCGSKLRGN